MAELYGTRHGRDILFGSKGYIARDAYNPAEPRAASGEWTAGGGSGEGHGAEASSAAPSARAGVVAKGERAASDWRDEVANGSPIKTVDDALAAAEPNQASLGELGGQIAQVTGTEFNNPGTKQRARLEAKLAGKGRTAARITDAVRAGFVVTKPEQADEIVANLAKHYPVADEGWKVTSVGYFDRKALVKFPNGQLGEVQMWHPEMLAAKAEGHKHYEAMQALPIDDVAGHEREAAAQRQIYYKVLDHLPLPWKAVLGSLGS